jgi:hypothetical protein
VLEGNVPLRSKKAYFSIFRKFTFQVHIKKVNMGSIMKWVSQKLLEELDAEAAAEQLEEIDLWRKELVRICSRDSPTFSAKFSGTMEREATSLFCY